MGGHTEAHEVALKCICGFAESTPRPYEITSREHLVQMDQTFDSILLDSDLYAEAQEGLEFSLSLKPSWWYPLAQRNRALVGDGFTRSLPGTLGDYTAAEHCGQVDRQVVWHTKERNYSTCSCSKYRDSSEACIRLHSSCYVPPSPRERLGGIQETVDLCWMLS